MDKFYKIMGFVIPIVAIGIAYMIVANFDLRSVTTENDFITAMLHSESVYQISEKGKIVLGTAISALGFCFGILSFGIGTVLSRLKKMGIR